VSDSCSLLTVVGSVEKQISQSADLPVAAALLLVLRVVEETDT